LCDAVVHFDQELQRVTKQDEIRRRAEITAQRTSEETHYAEAMAGVLAAGLRDCVPMAVLKGFMPKHSNTSFIRSELECVRRLLGPLGDESLTPPQRSALGSWERELELIEDEAGNQHTDGCRWLRSLLDYAERLRDGAALPTERPAAEYADGLQPTVIHGGLPLPASAIHEMQEAVKALAKSVRDCLCREPKAVATAEACPAAKPAEERTETPSRCTLLGNLKDQTETATNEFPAMKPMLVLPDGEPSEVVTMVRQISDDELWQILGWRPSPPDGNPDLEAVLWAKFEVQSADHDLPLYACRFLRVLEFFRGGAIGSPVAVEKQSLCTAIVSGLVVSGFDNCRGTAEKAKFAVMAAQERGLVIVDDVDEWRPGMRSGSGWTQYVHLTVAGRQLAASRDQKPSLDDEQAASAGEAKSELAVSETLPHSVEEPSASPRDDAAAQYGAGPQSEETVGEMAVTREPLPPSRHHAYVAYWYVIRNHPECDTEEKVYGHIREHGLPAETGLEGWNPPPKLKSFKDYLREARRHYGDNEPTCQPADARSVVSASKSDPVNTQSSWSIAPKEQRLRDIDRLRELASDVHLSSNEEEAEVWATIVKILERLEVSADRIKGLCKTTDTPKLLDICDQLEGETQRNS